MDPYYLGRMLQTPGMMMQVPAFGVNTPSNTASSAMANGRQFALELNNSVSLFSSNASMQGRLSLGFLAVIIIGIGLTYYWTRGYQA